MEEDEISIKSGVLGQAARPKRGLFVAAIWPRFGQEMAAFLTSGKSRGDFEDFGKRSEHRFNPRFIRGGQLGRRLDDQRKLVRAACPVKGPSLKQSGGWRCELSSNLANRQATRVHITRGIDGGLKT